MTFVCPWFIDLPSLHDSQLVHKPLFWFSICIGRFDKWLLNYAEIAISGMELYF